MRSQAVSFQTQCESWDKEDEQQCGSILTDIGWSAADDEAVEAQLVGMPSVLEDAIRNGIGKDGVRLWFNPEVRAHLVARAVKGVRSMPGHDAVEERGALEQEMSDRGSGYWRGPDAERKQSRYRMLIEHGGSGGRPMPATPSAIQAEIASIEKVMREDRRRYGKDERMQSRYRELLARGS